MTFAKEFKGKIDHDYVMTRSDIADDAYVDVERHMAAALARD